MRELIIKGICICVCFTVLMGLIVGCNLNETSDLRSNEISDTTITEVDNENNNEIMAEKYFQMDDFASIIIGESTLHDVCEIESSGHIFATSYGGFCEFPMENGGAIRVEFYGPDWIVRAVRKVDSPIDDSKVIKRGQGDCSLP